MTYGQTLKLDSKMDLVFDEKHRVPIVTGEDKVVQDLEMLFRIHLGEVIFDPLVGLDFEAIMEIDSDRMKKQIIQKTAEQYQYTKRVKEITIIQEKEGDEWVEKWYLTIELVTGDELTLVEVV